MEKKEKKQENKENTRERNIKKWISKDIASILLPGLTIYLMIALGDNGRHIESFQDLKNFLLNPFIFIPIILETILLSITFYSEE